MNGIEGIGERIRAARKAAGLTQQKLAEIAGSSQSAVNRLENGDSEYSRHMIPVLAALGIDYSDPSTPDGLPLATRIREAERLRMIAQDLKAKAADLEAMAARLERG